MISLVFDRNPELGHDPNDPYKRPYRLGEFFDTEGLDVLLIVRQYGDEFDGGSETQVWTAGAWEHVTSDQIEDTLDRLGDLE